MTNDQAVALAYEVQSQGIVLAATHMMLANPRLSIQEAVDQARAIYKEVTLGRMGYVTAGRR